MSGQPPKEEKEAVCFARCWEIQKGEGGVGISMQNTGSFRFKPRVMGLQCSACWFIPAHR